MPNLPYMAIDKFLGMDTSRNSLSLIPGQLMLNHNYLYMANGGIEQRGGGDKLTNAVVAGTPLYGLANFKTNSDNEYLIAIHNTDIYYYSSGWNSIYSAMTANTKTRFEAAGSGANRALYVCNGVDIVKEVKNDVPTASEVALSPTVTMMKLHKKRLFGIGTTDTMYFTDASAFTTWATGTNTILVDPGNNGYLKALEVWGDALFIFKEYAVYVLPNASDPTPATDWLILRTDASTGTQSPDTVKRTRDGIYYFGTDNFIHKIAPDITYSSAEYSLGGSGNPIVSYAIQDDLVALADLSAKARYMSVVHKDLYIFSFQSINASGTFNDKTFFADTTKFLPGTNISVPQPFWGEFTGFDYNFYAQQTVSDDIGLYGAKGDTGEVHQTLDPGSHDDNGDAIQSKFQLGWVAPGGPGLYKVLKNFTAVSITMTIAGADLTQGIIKLYQPVMLQKWYT